MPYILHELNFDYLFNYKYYNCINTEIKHSEHNYIIKEDCQSNKYLFYKRIFIVTPE
jgi:hypothetical protein